MQPKLGQPVEKRQSLNAGPIGPGPILLVDNYVAFTATDLTSNAGDPQQQPITASYGGNFAYYVQHRITGNVGPKGALHGGIRSQVESVAIGHPDAPTNDPVAFYGGVYNGGRGLGAFGAHIDAYHAGEAVGRHSTYGMSAELWKRVPGGVMAGYVARSQDAHPVDYGLVALNVGQGVGFGRFLQLGTPVYEQGGPVGSAGQVIPCDVGLDLSWASFRHAWAQVPAGSWLVWSGYPQAQQAAPITFCRSRWNDQTGNWEVRNGNALRFGVNMSDGTLFIAAKSLDPQGRIRVVVEDDSGQMRTVWLRTEG